MECPCRECKLRHPACHSTCDNYIAWRKEKDDLNRRIRNDAFYYRLGLSEKRMSNIRKLKKENRRKKI